MSFFLTAYQWGGAAALALFLVLAVEAGDIRRRPFYAVSSCIGAAVVWPLVVVFVAAVWYLRSDLTEDFYE